MRFALTDFFQDGIYRVFAFQKLPQAEGTDRYWVKADMTQARRYGISLQELPLLCRAALEVYDGTEHAITFTAREMMLVADERANAALSRTRKSTPFRRAAATSGE